MIIKKIKGPKDFPNLTFKHSIFWLTPHLIVFETLFYWNSDSGPKNLKITLRMFLQSTTELANPLQLMETSLNSTKSQNSYSSLAQVPIFYNAVFSRG